MDVLTDVLTTLELKGWLSSRRELAPPWRYDFAASQDSVFHVLSFGGAYLQVEADGIPMRRCQEFRDIQLGHADVRHSDLLE